MNVYNRKWLIPLTIGIILISAWFMRWETEATKSIDDSSVKVIKWQRDCWTNKIYIELFALPDISNNQTKIYAVYPPTPDKLTTYATYAWTLVMIADGAWLAWALLRKRQKAEIPTEEP